MVRFLFHHFEIHNFQKKKNAMSLQMQEGEDLGMCPSFNSYSTGTTADAARRAGGERSGGCSPSQSLNRAEDNNDDDDDDFEFVSLLKSTDCDLFRGGLIAPVFPIFDSDLLFEVERAEIVDRDSEISQPMRISFENLKIRDRDSDPSSSSSSSVDELEGVPTGTFCVWKPKSIGSPDLDCRKSRSTGSSSTKRWGIRDLLRRSHSDGKHSYASFTPSASWKSPKKANETKSAKNVKEKRVFSAHESFYVRNRTVKEEGKRKSYLPYKTDLVGCWRSAGGSATASSFWSF